MARVGGGRWAVSPVTVAVLPVAAGVVVNFATGGVAVDAWWWTPLAWVLTGVLVVVAVWSQIHQTRARGLAAEETLGRLARRRYAAEAVRLGLRSPAPLAVPWASTERPVAAAREVVLDEPGTSWASRPLAGDATGIAAAYRALPHRQLVVLGTAGAGKSALALLLALELLESPLAHEPVPVVLPIADWLPGQEHIEEFVARRIAADHPRIDGTVAAGLLAQGRVLPVLDGFDELPADRHAAALRALLAPAAAGHPFVLTSRSHEYEQAVTDEGAVLARAAVVEIGTVTVEQAIGYLSHPEPARTRWQPVFERLRAERDGPLAVVLSSPLMVALARIGYQSPSTEPADLLAFDDERSVSAALLSGYVSGVYRDDGPAAPGTVALRRYRAATAERWLSWLAFILHVRTAPELHWWDLTRVARVRTGIHVVVLGGVVWAATNLAIAGAVVLAVMLAASRVFASMWPHARPPYRRAVYLAPRRRWLLGRAVRAGFGLVAGVMSGMLAGDVVLGLAGGAASALVCATVPNWPGFRNRHSTGATVLGAVVAGGQQALTGGMVFAGATALLDGDVDAVPVAAAVYGSLAALCAGFWTWYTFRTAHLLLVAWRRRFPLLLKAFGRDAHRRGVLRQTGTTWEFRHAILQNHLSAAPVRRHLAYRADSGDERAALRLSELLSEKGMADELRTRADAGDRHAHAALANLLLAQHKPHEARTVFRELMAADPSGTDWANARKLADLLVEDGDVDEALTILRDLAEKSDGAAVNRIVEILTDTGRMDELRSMADRGEWHATRAYATFLAEQGNEEELRDRADAGDRHSADALAQLLAAQEREDELRDRVRAGDWQATEQLIRLLAGQHRVAEATEVVESLSGGDSFTYHQMRIRLHAAIDAPDRIHDLRLLAGTGDEAAGRLLANRLADEGNLDEATAILGEHTDKASREQLADLLIRRGDRDDALVILGELAENDDGGYHAGRFARELEVEGRDDEALAVLAPLVARQQKQAVEQYAELLCKRGDWQRAQTLLRTVHAGRSAEHQMAAALAKHGREDDLRTLASNGVSGAVSKLATLLADRGDTASAIALLRTHVERGDVNATFELAELLAQQGAVDEGAAMLDALADGGYRDAAGSAASLRARHNPNRTPAKTTDP